MRLGGRRVGAAFIALGIALLLTLPVFRWWRAAEFLKALGRGAPEASRKDEGAAKPTVREEDLTFEGALGPIRARLYIPARSNGRGVVVAHGVHYRGIDERRLVPFVRELARTGLLVLTPELSELSDYRITRQGVSVIRDAVRFLASQRLRLEEPRVGLLGFSFAGGLALVAASEAETARRLDFVGSIGGHHDLSRVLRFLLQDRVETPQGVRRLKAHDYGLLVLTYGNLERFVPAADLVIMRHALRAWLEERRVEARVWASRRTTFESERLWLLIENENLRELASTIEASIASQRSELAALSPRGRLRKIGAPVYLLHGSADRVIPASEVDWAHLELDSREHHVLVSPLLDHIEVSRKAAFSDRIALVRFMARLL